MLPHFVQMFAVRSYIVLALLKGSCVGVYSFALYCTLLIPYARSKKDQHSSETSRLKLMKNSMTTFPGSKSLIDK